MKLNARIRDILKRQNHWMTLEALRDQGMAADNIKIYLTQQRAGEVYAVSRSFRAYDPGAECTPSNGNQSYWSTEFAIRDRLGNPTQIGELLGIHARDKKISPFSARGKAIFDFLNRMAWIDACRLTEDPKLINDKTGYKERLEAEKISYEMVA